MTTDLETPTLPTQSTSLPGLTERLSTALDIPAHGQSRQEMLERQAHALDLLFSSLIEKRVLYKVRAKTAAYPEDEQRWLHLALRAQRQCAETLRTSAAIRYMDTLCE